MPSASDTFMNFTDFTFTSGVTVYTIDEVLDANPQRMGETKQLRTSNHNYPVHMVIRNRHSQVQITSANVWALAVIPVSAVGVLAGTLCDEHNGAGTGSLTIVLNNCQVQNNPFQGRNNEYAQGTLMFVGASDDGQTDPLVLTRVSGDPGPGPSPDDGPASYVSPVFFSPAYGGGPYVGPNLLG